MANSPLLWYENLPASLVSGYITKKHEDYGKIWLCVAEVSPPPPSIISHQECIIASTESDLFVPFPFLLVTIIIVLSGLVTMHRVQGQSISRIHTHQATSLSLVSLLCLCRRCKKRAAGVILSGFAHTTPVEPFHRSVRQCFFVPYRARDLTITGLSRGRSNLQARPRTSLNRPDWKALAIRMWFCLLLCIKSNSMDAASNEAFW